MAAAKNSEAPLEMWPHNPEAEAAVLGCILDPTIPGALAVCADELRLAARDFRLVAHELIYAAALDLRAHDTPANSLTVTDALEFAGKLDDVGGAAYVDGLTTRAAPSGNVRPYAEIVKRCANQRRTMKLSGDLARAGHAGDFADVTRIRGEIDALLTDAQPVKQRFQLLSDEEVENLPQPDMLVGSLLVRDTLALLYGDSGTGKSFFALDIALRVATGRDWYGHATVQGPVVYIAAEGAPGMAKRLRAWKAHYGATGATGVQFIGCAVQLLDDGEVQELIRTLATMPTPPALVIVDTLGRSMDGGDESDNSDVHRVVSASDAIRRATGATVLLVHHVGKDEEKGPRGASALRGDMDTVIGLKRDGETTHARCVKQKDLEPFAPFAFRLRRIALDDHADSTSCVIERCDEARAEAGKLRNSEATALECLEASSTPMTNKDWQQTAEVLGGISERTFIYAKKAMLEAGYVAFDNDRYTLTHNGALMLQLHRNQGAIAGGP